MNKDNLILLRNFLETNKQARNHFDMRYYRRNSNGMTDFISIKYCGTVGCALGWAPFVKGLEVVKSDFSEWEFTVDFEKYADRVFDLYDNETWNYLFNAEWKGTQPTADHFIARVDMILNGFDPETERWDYYE